MSVVAERTGAFTTAGRMLSLRNGSGGAVFYFNSSADQVAAFALSTLTATASNSAFHAFNVTVTNSGGTINVDPTETSGTVGTQNGSMGWAIGADANAGTYLTRKLTEAGFWANNATSTTIRDNLCHNQYTYWATSTSC